MAKVKTSRRAGIFPALCLWATRRGAGILPALLLALASPAPAPAQPRLALPLDCQPGRDCHLQNFVDADPGPQAQDFTCGPLSYDGHKGTDFALPTLAAMQAGVTVRAAAPGVVTGLRDGMEDRPWTPEQDLQGRDCGNGVVIDHGAGWETQYCHMAQGSIRVTEGQQVETGAPLGQVGLSGRTQFPHLHLSLRHDGATVDPFAPDASLPCETAQQMLWAEPLDYAPGGILDAGFLDALPEYDAVKAGTAGRAALPSDSPALVLWASLFGARAGDILTLTISAPDGPFTSQDLTLERPQAQLFRASGKRTDGLAPGLYTGRVTLTRAGEILAQHSTQVQITP